MQFTVSPDFSQRGSVRTPCAPLRVVEQLAQQKGSTLEGLVKAVGCSLVAGYYFQDACYYLLDGSW